MEADPDQRASTATRVLEGGGCHCMGGRTALHGGLGSNVSLSLSLSLNMVIGFELGNDQIETGCSIRPKLVCNFLIKKGCQVIALLDT